VMEEVDASSLWEGEQDEDEEAMDDDDGKELVVLGGAWCGALEPSDGGTCCWLVVGASCGAARCWSIVGD